METIVITETIANQSNKPKPIKVKLQFATDVNNFILHTVKNLIDNLKRTKEIRLKTEIF